MRPLPRLHALTDARVLALADLGVRAAAIAAAGSSVALHARDRTANAAALASAAFRLRSLARPPEASLFVNARPDLAAVIGAQGVQLGRDDLSPVDARYSFPQGWIGCSVHDTREAATAVEEGADFLLVGNVWETGSHPGRPGTGLALIRDAAAFGRPVVAVGGVNPSRAAEARDAGAYGVAAIAALWDAPDPAAAALALLAPWLEDA